MWIKGLTHFHTAFNYPDKEKITPMELAMDLKSIGLNFAFCAGDHGHFNGDYYWGINHEEFKEYADACLAVNNESAAILIPTPELHLMFPPYNERHDRPDHVPPTAEHLFGVVLP